VTVRDGASTGGWAIIDRHQHDVHDAHPANQQRNARYKGEQHGHDDALLRRSIGAVG